jgi:hypothetical protein
LSGTQLPLPLPLSARLGGGKEMVRVLVRFASKPLPQMG